jgi:hypothetical protein
MTNHQSSRTTAGATTKAGAEAAEVFRSQSLSRSRSFFEANRLQTARNLPKQEGIALRLWQDGQLRVWRWLTGPWNCKFFGGQRRSRTATQQTGTLRALDAGEKLFIPTAGVVRANSW